MIADKLLKLEELGYASLLLLQQVVLRYAVGV
jgi:hypothetical protein